MLRIYHVKGTRGFRPIWTCEELGLPYEVEVVDFSAEFRSSPEWRRLSPTGKVPVMTDGELTMFESCAMVDYILERYGQGRLSPPAATPASALYRQWCWFGEATFARPLGEIVNHRRVAPEGRTVDFVIEDCKARAQLCIDALEGALTDADYLVDDTFSAADIVVGYALMLADSFGVLSDANPRARAYLARLAERPGYQVALGAG